MIFQTIIIALALTLTAMGLGMAIYGGWREEMLRRAAEKGLKNPGGLLYIIIGSAMIGFAGLILTLAAKALGG